MAKQKAKNVAHTEAIFLAAIAEGVSATQARTLAECLYWSQHTRHEIDGQRALYKTGPELSDKLGLTARTINRHLKQLGEDGFWRIRYRPRPKHPSPVTWLVIAERSEVLLANAKAERKGQGRHRTSDRAERRQSDVRTCDAQRSHYDTTYIETVIQNDRGETSFISDSDVRKNEPSAVDNDRIRAPRYVESTRELEKFVETISRILAVKGLPPWDTVSRFTWQHVRDLIEKLQAEGVSDLADQIKLVGRIIKRWSVLRCCMDDRYTCHDGNDDRPTPMALNHQIKKLISALDILSPKDCSLEKGGSNFDEGFF